MSSIFINYELIYTCSHSKGHCGLIVGTAIVKCLISVKNLRDLKQNVRRFLQIPIEIILNIL